MVLRGGGYHEAVGHRRRAGDDGPNGGKLELGCDTSRARRGEAWPQNGTCRGRGSSWVLYIGRGDGRAGDDGGKSILPFQSHKGEGEESVECCLMRGNEVVCVALRFGYSRVVAGGQRHHTARRH
jgi:hypothetical protein